MSRIFDHFNRTIRNGDVITYPVRKGSNMWLQTGKVDDIRSNGSVGVINPHTGRRATVFNTDMALLASNSVRRAVNQQIRALAA